MVGVRTLANVMAFGGVITVGTGIYLKKRMRDDLRSTDVYQNALKMLRTHPGSVMMLGEPIEDGNFSVDPRDNNCNGETGWYTIPVSGKNDKGMYHFWIERKENNEWGITRAELELKKHPDKRLVILKAVENIK